MAADFLQQLHRFIVHHKMISPGETVLVAVSGGADSLALLYGLHALRPQLNCKLHVGHLNHRLRPEAEAEADFVQQHALQLQLPYTIQKAEVLRLAKQNRLSIETAGRTARYLFYESVCTEVNATRVAIGHHRDDSVETLLINLLRGSGAAGLKGIAPIREKKFIRPLAKFTRRDIETFLAARDIAPRHDATNTDLSHVRNRIRHKLLPQLETDYNPNIKTGLSRTADILSTESEYLDTAATEAFETCRIPTLSRTVTLDRTKFRQYHLALQRRILRLSISEMLQHTNDLYFVHSEAMLNLIEADAPNTVLPLPNGLQFRRTYQHLIFEKIPAETENFAYPLTTAGKTVIDPLKAEIIAELREANILRSTLALPTDKFEAVIDYEKLIARFGHTQLIVRNRRRGDRFQPYGLHGTKKLKDFFIDAKVPRCERDRTPLLVCQDDILWIIGYTIGEPFKIEPDTRRYLYLRYANKVSSPGT